jgi:hypothetical protein
VSVVPVLVGDGGVGVVAGGEPDLGVVAEGEVVGGGRAAHAGRYPAGIDDIAVHVGPAAGDGRGERGDEELAVAVGLGAVPAAAVPVEVVEVGRPEVCMPLLR